MAPLLFREMKGLNFSCTAPASTAICTSIDRRSIVQPTHGHPIRDTSHTPHLREYSRRSDVINHLSKSLSKPKNYMTQKSRKSTEKPADVDLITPLGSSRYLLNDNAFFDISPGLEPAVLPPPPLPPLESPRFLQPPRLLSSSCMQSIDSPRFQPLSSSRMQSIESPRLQPLGRRDIESVLLRSSSSSVLPIASPRLQPPRRSESAAVRPALSSTMSPRLLQREEPAAVLRPASSPTRLEDQVVVLRVSLHCKGCAGKVRKHISKMEGVTSFNIDMVAKKVTVIGDVTPLGVLNSVSKVKNAQLWMPSPPCMSASF